MLTSVLGARMRWHLANGSVFDPTLVQSDTVEYTLVKGPHVGRHDIQHFYYQRVAPGVEITVWYEESGAVVHFTWYVATNTMHRWPALPVWLASDISKVYAGDNQDRAFVAKIRLSARVSRFSPPHAR
jgi:phenolic acid decarboxylase